MTTPLAGRDSGRTRMRSAVTPAGQDVGRARARSSQSGGLSQHTAGTRKNSVFLARLVWDLKLVLKTLHTIQIRVFVFNKKINHIKLSFKWNMHINQ